MKIDQSLCERPDLEFITEIINRPNDSAPGPDGIPFAVWRAAPDLAAPILLRVFDAIAKGHTPPEGFNHGLLYLLPKKDTGLISDTRPLSVTNTDNRILAAAVARSIMPVVDQYIDPSQKGFLAGKNSGDHIVEINGLFYEAVVQKLSRLLFLLDTAKAFDSVDHDWVHLVLERVKFPPWVRHFVKGSLHAARSPSTLGPIFPTELTSFGVSNKVVHFLPSFSSLLTTPSSTVCPRWTASGLSPMPTTSPFLAALSVPSLPPSSSSVGFLSCQALGSTKSSRSPSQLPAPPSGQPLRPSWPPVLGRTFLLKRLALT